MVVATLRLPFVVLAVVGLSFVATILVAQDAKKDILPQRARAIQRLIDELDSPHYRTREAATRALGEMEESLPALGRALQSPSAEVRRRAEMIIAVIQGRQRHRALAADMAKGKRVAIDLLVERLVHKGKDAERKEREAVVEIARAMLAWANSVSGSERQVSQVLRLNDLSSFKYVSAGKWCEDRFAEREWIELRSLDTKSTIQDSVLLCNGSLVIDSLYKDLAFVSGDVWVGRAVPQRSICRSLVFCDGNMIVYTAAESVIVATGKVNVVDENDSFDNVILENARNPLPFLTLFDAALEGIEVQPARDGAQVTKIQDGKPFARAGFRKGDLMVAVGDTKITSADDFRRTLRRLVAEKAKGVYRILRAGKALEIPIDFSD